MINRISKQNFIGKFSIAECRKCAQNIGKNKHRDYEQPHALYAVCSAVRTLDSHYILAGGTLVKHGVAHVYWSMMSHALFERKVVILEV